MANITSPSRPRFPSAPDAGQPVENTADLNEVSVFLARRRSAGKMMLAEPGPTESELGEILRVGLRVPDHRRVEPWRLIIIQGEARARLGDQIAERFQALNLDASEKAIEDERARPLRSPVTVFVVNSPNHTHKTPVWEQELSTGAVCHQLCLAAMAAGFGAAWLTEWICFDEEIARILGLQEHERFAGQILIGTQTALSPERPRPDMASKITLWAGA